MARRIFSLKKSRIVLPDGFGSAQTIRRIGRVRDAAFLSEKPQPNLPKKQPSAAASIVGPDDRARVPNPAAFPFSAICHLLVLDAAGRVIAQGTGWFASSNTVVTAAHVVAPIENGAPRPAAAIRVIPGRNDTSAPFGSLDSQRFAFAPGWVTGSEEHDFGAIRVGPFPNNPGVFEPGPFTDPQIPQIIANLTGYPATPPSGPAGTQWGQTGRVGLKPGEPSMLAYTMDMSGGQSGAPLLVSVQNRMFVAGINVVGLASFNEAVRMTPAVAGQIGTWVNSAI